MMQGLMQPFELQIAMILRYARQALDRLWTLRPTVLRPVTESA